ncbi:uncharacterized [Tachysurus ichikawai]
MERHHDVIRSPAGPYREVEPTERLRYGSSVISVSGSIPERSQVPLTDPYSNVEESHNKISSPELNKGFHRQTESSVLLPPPRSDHDFIRNL